MCTAIAIYGTENIPPETAYEIGMLFFKVIELDITSTGYYKYREDRSEEDIDFIEVSLSDLKNELKNKNATSFRFYNESEKSNYWTASFGFSTSDFGGFIILMLNVHYRKMEKRNLLNL